MPKLCVLTLVSLLIVAVTVGCTVDSSSTDQAGVIETAVASGLETALADNVEPTATTAPAATSTPEPLPTDTPVPKPTVVPRPTPEPTAEPTPLTISTELSQCVTLVAFLASNHWHEPYISDDAGILSTTSSSSRIHRTSAEQMFNDYCGSYIDSQLLEKFNARDWDAPALLPLERLK